MRTASERYAEALDRAIGLLAEWEREDLELIAHNNRLIAALGGRRDRVVPPSGDERLRWENVDE